MNLQEQNGDLVSVMLVVLHTMFCTFQHNSMVVPFSLLLLVFYHSKKQCVFSYSEHP